MLAETSGAFYQKESQKAEVRPPRSLDSHKCTWPTGGWFAAQAYPMQRSADQDGPGPTTGAKQVQNVPHMAIIWGMVRTARAQPPPWHRITEAGQPLNSPRALVDFH